MGGIGIFAFQSRFNPAWMVLCIDAKSPEEAFGLLSSNRYGASVLPTMRAADRMVADRKPWYIFQLFHSEDLQMAMGQNPNRTRSEHPNPTTKIGSKMGGAPTPKWYHWF